MFARRSYGLSLLTHSAGVWTGLAGVIGVLQLIYLYKAVSECSDRASDQARGISLSPDDDDEKASEERL